ncbi:MAG TPA: holo-ACP synthase [Solimonas sp.]|nr:holo-ACP synthase [Solimonas sp.]
MIYGIGTDILRLERMEKIWARHGERLADKILGPEERREFDRRLVTHRRPARYLAMAFAGKEAFVKALGTGFHGVAYADAGVVHLKTGKPVLVFSPRMRVRLKRLGISGGHVSLSDEGGLICAMVVLEGGAAPRKPVPTRPAKSVKVSRRRT